MSFLDVVQKWYSSVFGIVEDLYSHIMSYDWLAFSFWSVFILGLLALIAYMTPTLQSAVNMVIRSRRQIERDIRQSERDIRQRERDLVRANKEREEKGKRNFANFLMGLDDRVSYVTIEGKRYYRKGYMKESYFNKLRRQPREGVMDEDWGEWSKDENS